MQRIGFLSSDCLAASAFASAAAPAASAAIEAGQIMQEFDAGLRLARHEALIHQALAIQLARGKTHTRRSELPKPEPAEPVSVGLGLIGAHHAFVAHIDTLTSDDVRGDWGMILAAMGTGAGAGESALDALKRLNGVIVFQVKQKYQKSADERKRPTLDELQGYFEKVFGHKATADELRELIGKFRAAGYTSGAVLNAMEMMLWYITEQPEPELPTLNTPDDKPQRALHDRMPGAWQVDDKQLRQLWGSIALNLNVPNCTFNLLPNPDGSGFAELANVGIDLHSLYQTLLARLILARRVDDVSFTAHEQDLFRMLNEDPSGFERAVLSVVLLNERGVTETPYGEVFLLRFLMMFYEAAVEQKIKSANTILRLTDWLAARAEQYVRSTLDKISNGNQKAIKEAMRGSYNNVVDPLLVAVDYNLWMGRQDRLQALKSEVVATLRTFYVKQGLRLTQDTHIPGENATAEEQAAVTQFGFSSPAAKYWRILMRTYSYDELADQIPGWLEQAEQDFPESLQDAPFYGYVNGRRADWIHFLRDLSEMEGIPADLAARARAAGKRHLDAELSVFMRFGNDVLGYTHWIADRLVTAVAGPSP